ncbi:MAG: class I SAM-dependent methyltransferase [Planctomycetes bacterium]|nr:class I SAM-dependent methyltransferase [Planctomycetota bacterium]
MGEREQTRDETRVLLGGEEALYDGEPGCGTAGHEHDEPGNAMNDSRRALFAMFLVTSCVLAFEVALTRVCSVLLEHHISFAVVSYAVLGLGLGGFGAYAWTGSRPERVRAATDVALLLIAPLMLLALASLVSLPFAEHWPYLLGLILPAFMAAGAFQSLMLREYAGRAGALYGADLAGGAAGAFSTVLALGWLNGPIHTIELVALVLSAGAWLWSARRKGTARGTKLVAPGVTMLVLACIVAQRKSGFLNPVYERAPNKLITRLLQVADGSQLRLLPQLQRWDAYSRVDVLERQSQRGVERAVFIDGETPTPMLAQGALSPGQAKLDIAATLPALPYRLFAPKSVLSIGSGAGYDVVIAKRMGAERVDAVELNAGVLELAEQEKEFTGEVYSQPGVSAHHDEGRLFARRAGDATYDLVVLALAQSLAGNLREHALSENYLYTQQALSDYLRVLRDGGTLAMLLDNEVSLRKLARTAIELFDERGIPGRECVAVVTHKNESPYSQLLLVRQRPFTAEERARLCDEIAAHDYSAPHLPAGDGATTQFSAAQLQGAPYRLEPASDDRPFFFNVYPGVPPGLRPVLWIASVPLVLAWIVAWYFGRRAGSTAGAGVRAGYFVLLGLAFMMVEVLALQKAVRLVGFPTLNLAVVLATFLLSAGLGSMTSQRIAPERARHVLRAVLVVLGLALVGLVPLLDLLYLRFDASSVPVRCLVIAAALAPFAFAMGMPFPLGLRLLPATDRARIPWFWGLNGVASILGSALVVAVVLKTGFRVGALLPAALYVLAAVFTVRLASTPSD